MKNLGGVVERGFFLKAWGAAEEFEMERLPWSVGSFACFEEVRVGLSVQKMHSWCLSFTFMSASFFSPPLISFLLRQSSFMVQFHQGFKAHIKCGYSSCFVEWNEEQKIPVSFYKAITTWIVKPSRGGTIK